MTFIIYLNNKPKYVIEFEGRTVFVGTNTRFVDTEKIINAVMRNTADFIRVDRRLILDIDGTIMTAMGYKQKRFKLFTFFEIFSAINLYENKKLSFFDIKISK